MADRTTRPSFSRSGCPACARREIFQQAPAASTACALGASRILESSHPGPAPEALAGRLAFLLKHAQLRLAELTGPALAPYGITGRELAVLIVLGGRPSLSQQQAAGRLAIDRTTMVGLIDGLESKGLVERHPDPADRRRNVVELTGAGRQTLRDASRIADEVERRFLAALGEGEGERLKVALRALVSHEGP